MARKRTTSNDPPPPVHNQQSPIDLNDSVYHEFDVGQVLFRYPVNRLTGVPEGADPGHGKVSVQGDVEVPLFGLRLKLVQLHFHSPSEHLFGGVAWPLELHLVHRIVAGQSGATTGSELLVIAVFFFAADDAPARGTLSRFGPVMNEAKAGRPAGRGSPSLEFNPNHCLPDLGERPRFYRYEGSLTSDPFSETVSWLVFERPVPVPEPDLLPILEAADQHARPAQLLNRRTVLRSFP